jgi:hypothetical protein
MEYTAAYQVYRDDREEAAGGAEAGAAAPH